MTTTSAVAVLKVLEKNDESALEILDISVSKFLLHNRMLMLMLMLSILTILSGLSPL